MFCNPAYEGSHVWVHHGPYLIAAHDGPNGPMRAQSYFMSRVGLYLWLPWAHDCSNLLPCIYIPACVSVKIEIDTSIFRYPPTSLILQLSWAPSWWCILSKEFGRRPWVPYVSMYLLNEHLYAHADVVYIFRLLMSFVWRIVFDVPIGLQSCRTTIIL